MGLDGGYWVSHLSCLRLTGRGRAMPNDPIKWSLGPIGSRFNQSPSEGRVTARDASKLELPFCLAGRVGKWNVRLKRRGKKRCEKVALQRRNAEDGENGTLHEKNSWFQIQQKTTQVFKTFLKPRTSCLAPRQWGQPAHDPLPPISKTTDGFQTMAAFQESPS